VTESIVEEIALIEASLHELQMLFDGAGSKPRRRQMPAKNHKKERLSVCLASPVKGGEAQRTNTVGEALRLAPDDTLLRFLLDHGLLRSGDGKGPRLTASGQVLFQFLLRCQVAKEAPRYDASRRALSWCDVVVKRLKRDAPSQEAVLEAFEAVGWPQRIDDPLEEVYGLDAKERLRETVKSLNRGLTQGTIRFHADGTGSGMCWERDDAMPDLPHFTPGQGEREP
jgi:hypothetical protein